MMKKILFFALAIILLRSSNVFATDFARRFPTNTPIEVLVPGDSSPAGADYLVGTANDDLSGEIVVGTTPGGELGGTWGTPTLDHDALDDQYYDSEADLTGLLDDNYEAIDSNDFDPDRLNGDTVDDNKVDAAILVEADPTIAASVSTQVLGLTPVGTQAITAASDTISSSYSALSLSADADYVMTSTPTITASTAGIIIVLHNKGAFDIDLQANSILAGSTIYNEGVDSILEPNDVMTVMYFDDADGSGNPGWRVQSHPNPSAAAGSATLLDVRNASGSSIAALKPVYISGFNAGQDRPLIALADGDNAAAMPAIGLTYVSIDNNKNGMVVTNGEIGNVNTSGWTAGDTLYVDTTAGALTITRPTVDDVQAVGRVLYSHATKGEILVVGAGRVNDTDNAIVAETSVTSPIIDTPLIQDAATIHLRPSGDADDYVTVKTDTNISYIGRDDDDDLIKLEANTVTVAGTVVADALTMDADEPITLGGKVLDYDSSNADFEMNDDLNIKDLTGEAHLRLQGSGRAYEMFAAAQELVFTDYTNQKQLLKFDPNYNASLPNSPSLSVNSKLIPVDHIAQGTFDLAAQYDVDTDLWLIDLHADSYPAGIYITEVYVDCTVATPSTDLDANLTYCDAVAGGAFPGASPQVIVAIDTTAGNFADAAVNTAVATGKSIYIDLDADPVDSTTMYHIRIHYYIPTS